jgi:hypothetical protein
MLNVKTLSLKNKNEFDKQLSKLINTVGPGSVQYRPCVDDKGKVIYTACLIYETMPEQIEKKGE